MRIAATAVTPRQVIISRRGHLRLTQDQLAARARVSTRSVWEMERGTRIPRATTVAAVERALRLPEGTLASMLAPAGGDSISGDAP